VVVVAEYLAAPCGELLVVVRVVDDDHAGGAEVGDLLQQAGDAGPAADG
jgi:hypothetical protein